MKNLKKMKNEKKKKMVKFFTKLSKKWPKMAHNGKKWPNFEDFCFIVFSPQRTPRNWYWSFSYDFLFKSYSKVNFLGQKQAIMGEKRPKYAKITNKLGKKWKI